MKLQFRQGIVRYNQHQGPAILAPAGQSVNVNVIDNPIVIAFAHYDTTYIAEETRSVVGAWGGGGTNNGALTGASTYFLYWEIDRNTGGLTRGWTSIPWVYNSVAPANPALGTHWFDTVNKVMKLWSQNGSNPGYWTDVIRVFAGVYNGATVTQYPIGSQVGSVCVAGPGQSFTGGNVILGANNAPLRQNNGQFLTTSSSMIANNTAGVNVSLEAAVVFGEAIEPIPGYYLVSFMPGRKIKLARAGDILSTASGIVNEPMATGEISKVITGGLVRNVQWNFAPELVGMPIYLGPTGEIWTQPPPNGLVQRVGEVYSEDAVNLNFQQPIRLFPDEALLTGSVLVLQTDGRIASATFEQAFGGTALAQTAADVNMNPVLPAFPSAGTVQTTLEQIATTIAANINPCATFGFTHKQDTAASVWQIFHGRGSEFATVAVYDESGAAIFPDEILIIDENLIEVHFVSDQAGKANIVFTPIAAVCCEGMANVPGTYVVSTHLVGSDSFISDSNITDLVVGKSWTASLGFEVHDADSCGPSFFVESNSGLFADGAGLVGLANNPDYDLGQDDFVITVDLANYATGGTKQHLVGFWDPPVYHGWHLIVSATGQVGFEYSTNGSYDPARSVITPSPVIGADDVRVIWKRVGGLMTVSTYDGTTTTQVLTFNCGTDTIFFPATMPLRIGTNINNQHFFGRIGRLLIVKGSVSGFEASALATESLTSTECFTD